MNGVSFADLADAHALSLWQNNSTYCSYNEGSVRAQLLHSFVSSTQLTAQADIMA